MWATELSQEGRATPGAVLTLTPRPRMGRWNRGHRRIVSPQDLPSPSKPWQLQCDFKKDASSSVKGASSAVYQPWERGALLTRFYPRRQMQPRLGHISQ